MERRKRNPDVEAFLDKLWEDAKTKGLDIPSSYGKFGVLFDVADSVLIQAFPQCQPIVRMPRTNQNA